MQRDPAAAGAPALPRLSPLPPPPTSPLPGGTRFIGVYLARQLVEQGHEVTLFTRGKKAITQKLAGESDWEYERFKNSVKHIAGDRQVLFLFWGGRRGGSGQGGVCVGGGVPRRAAD
jgi:hypothetical protein